MVKRELYAQRIPRHPDLQNKSFTAGPVPQNALAVMVCLFAACAPAFTYIKPYLACVYVNEYYSQCQATPAPPTSSTVTSAPVISPTFVSSGTTYCGSGPITFKREIVARTCYPAVTTATRYSSTSVVTSYYPSSSCYPYHPSAPACSTSYSTTTGILTTTITVPPPARTAL